MTPLHAITIRVPSKGSPIERRKRGGGSDGRRRHGCERSIGAQEEECEENLGERRLLVASPPSSRKRVSGARPYVGRSPPTPPSGCVQREEKREQDGRGCGSRPTPKARSCGVTGMRGEEDGSTCSRQSRSAAAEEEKEQMDADAAISAIMGDDENDSTHRARGHDRVRLCSNEESVRAVAGNFVDNVFDDLSSTASLSRMSLK